VKLKLEPRQPRTIGLTHDISADAELAEDTHEPLTEPCALFLDIDSAAASVEIHLLQEVVVKVEPFPPAAGHLVEAAPYMAIKRLVESFGVRKIILVIVQR
jgi:hypothetical protein